MGRDYKEWYEKYRQMFDMAGIPDLSLPKLPDPPTATEVASIFKSAAIPGLDPVPKDWRKETDTDIAVRSLAKKLAPVVDIKLEMRHEIDMAVLRLGSHLRMEVPVAMKELVQCRGPEQIEAMLECCMHGFGQELINMGEKLINGEVGT